MGTNRDRSYSSVDKKIKVLKERQVPLPSSRFRFGIDLLQSRKNAPERGVYFVSIGYENGKSRWIAGDQYFKI